MSNLVPNDYVSPALMTAHDYSLSDYNKKKGNISEQTADIFTPAKAYNIDDNAIKWRVNLIKEMMTIMDRSIQ